MTEEEQIKDLYRTYWKYMIQKDVDGLRQIMSTEYSLRHMTGVQQTREEFLKGLSGGTFHYFSAEHDSMEVIVQGDKAEMTGKSRVWAAVYGGGKHRWRLQGDFILRKENGKWMLTSSEASTY